MKEIRALLLQDTEITQLLNGEHIYLIEKPEQINAENYIIYKYKPLAGGLIKDYQLEFNLIGKDILKLLQLQNRLITLLDDMQAINLDNIRYIKLLNGGGMIKNPDTSNYHIILYFLVKTH
ncbi:hypothetical protein [Caldicoprobacter faecalis]|uniref:Uncharacterized protein n=1 Tax=Caldicoprobacter faecalis TaxID=937334 RepID=A0A1I5WSV2_9FIRM|nr:hypothetical protein [Caldicoprobacter faecalis]SFQ22819.1 hypothetical protein SAMN05444406_11917 [Caldicoprobacter faecalis]